MAMALVPEQEAAHQDRRERSWLNWNGIVQWNSGWAVSQSPTSAMVWWIRFFHDGRSDACHDLVKPRV